MKTQKHTELPWFIGDRRTEDNTLELKNDKYSALALACPRPHYADNQLENAQYIVTACNNHHALLKALKHCVLLNQDNHEHSLGKEKCLWCNAEAAIAKAEGENK